MTNGLRRHPRRDDRPRLTQLPRGGEDAVIKEYKTIQEVAGPLMLVEQRRGRHLRRAGERSSCRTARSAAARCWRSNGDNARGAAVRKRSRASTSPTARSASWATRMELGVSEDMLGRVFDGMGQPIDGGPEILPEEHLRHQRPAHEPRRPRLPARVHPDRRFRHRRTEHPGPRPEAADLLRLRSAPRAAWPRRSPVRRRCSARASNFAVVFAAIGITFEEAELLHSGLHAAPAPSTVRCCSSNLANDPAVERIATPAYGADRRGVSGV